MKLISAMKISPSALLLVATLASSVQLIAQPTTSAAMPPQTASQPSSYGSWPEVSINAVVVNDIGRPLDIDQNTLQLFEDSAPRSLRFSVSAKSPVSLALLIDFSTSTYKRRAEMLTAVSTIVHALPDESEVALIDFNVAAFIDAPFTQVSKLDLTVLDKLPARDLTTLWDAIVSTENYLASSAKYPREAIVILSDGEDNASSASEQTFAQALEWPGAPFLYFCKVDGLATNHDMKLPRREHKTLEIITQKGGGIVFDHEPDLLTAASKAVADIDKQYLFQFTANNVARDGKARRLKLQLPDKEAKIYSLPAYYAPDK
jgi:Ca-activated chloride channel homolog